MHRKQHSKLTTQIIFVIIYNCTKPGITDNFLILYVVTLAFILIYLVLLAITRK